MACDSYAVYLLLKQLSYQDTGEVLLLCDDIINIIMDSLVTLKTIEKLQRDYIVHPPIQQFIKYGYVNRKYQCYYNCEEDVISDTVIYQERGKHVIFYDIPPFLCKKFIYDFNEIA